MRRPGNSDDGDAYDASKIGILKGMAPPPKPGFTATWHPDLTNPESRIDACCGMLRADEKLWYMKVYDQQGRWLMVYRDPHP